MTPRRTVREVRVLGFSLLLLLLLAACCTRAQDLNSNEVVPGRVPAAATKPTTRSPIHEPPTRTEAAKKPLLASQGQAATSGRTLVCPLDAANAIARILSANCQRNADCNFLGAEHRCCKGICRRGVDAPLNEPPHQDFFGFRRKCPAYAFPERLPVKRCAKDEDCEGVNRICCPDKKDNKLYCRTAAPVWSALPFPENHETFKSLAGFVQCQSAPPTVIDIFARPCNKTMECFPNLCCQEGSIKVCRPPKRSLLGLAVQATSIFVKG